MFGATVALPLIICPALCIEETDPARAYIISTIFFVSGLITILQATFGVRLVQYILNLNRLINVLTSMALIRITLRFLGCLLFKVVPFHFWHQPLQS